MRAEIFYYVHHDGGGHRGRAAAICRHLGLDVTVLSSLPVPEDLHRWAPAGSGAARRWVQLEPDTGGVPADGYPDPTAHGRLHWVPLHHRGLQARHARVVREIADRRPALLVADVSVEIATLARLCGVPVAVVLQPGERSDSAHRWAFDLATGLLAPWPRPAQLPTFLEPWLDRVCFTGGISAATENISGAAAASSTPPAPTDAGTVLVAFGAGEEPADLISEAAAASPGWTWQTRDGGVGSWPDRLAAAEVVVAHAGLGTLADLATVGARAVVIAQDRPFGEQHATAQLVRALQIGPVLDRWPPPAAWPDLLRRARAADPTGWSGWEVRDGARLAARRLEEWAAA